MSKAKIRYKGRLVYTITQDDVGRPFSRLCRDTAHLSWGRVNPFDVGKQLFDHGGGIIQMESDSQRDARLGAHG